MSWKRSEFFDSLELTKNKLPLYQVWGFLQEKIFVQFFEVTVMTLHMEAGRDFEDILHDAFIYSTCPGTTFQLPMCLVVSNTMAS